MCTPGAPIFLNANKKSKYTNKYWCLTPFLHISRTLFREILSNFLSMWRIIWKQIENKHCVVSITIYITKFSVFFVCSVVCFFPTLNKICRMRLSKKQLSGPLKTFVNFSIFNFHFLSSFCTFVDVPIRASVYRSMFVPKR